MPRAAAEAAEGRGAGPPPPTQPPPPPPVHHVPGYRGELLALALDLGWRLLKAFDTPTGIPYGAVNLLHG